MTVIDIYSQNINDLINQISSIAYDEKLKTTLIIKSINCREWEKEKKIFERYKIPEGYLSADDLKKTATRYYVEVQSEIPKGNKHAHFGHFDFRPTSATICDAFLPIPKKSDYFVTCRKTYKSDDFENPTISTVPYIMPDDRLGCCAPSSLWIILTTLSNELGSQYYSLSDIAMNLPKDDFSKNGIKDFEALLRKMNYRHYYHYGMLKKDDLQKTAEKLQNKSECTHDNCPLSELFALVHLDTQNMSLMDSDTLYAYIESEIPVYLVFDFEDLLTLEVYSKWKRSEEEDNTKGKQRNHHAIVAIGHTSINKKGEYNFIVHDVDLSPFVIISQEFINKNLVEALVVLPEDTAHYAFIKKTFEKLLPDLLKIDSHLDSFLPINELKIRPFLMRSQRIKFWFTDKTKYPYEEIHQMFSVAEFPKYVWVFELSNNKTREKNQSLGHIIFNASVLAKELTPILITSPNYILWYENGNLQDSTKDKPDSFYKEGLPLFRCKVQ